MKIPVPQYPVRNPKYLAIQVSLHSPKMIIIPKTLQIPHNLKKNQKKHPINMPNSIHKAYRFLQNGEIIYR